MYGLNRSATPGVLHDWPGSTPSRHSRLQFYNTTVTRHPLVFYTLLHLIHHGEATHKNGWTLQASSPLLQGYLAHKCPPLGPYCRPTPEALWWSQGVGAFL